jgi:hypothetical protein
LNVDLSLRERKIRLAERDLYKSCHHLAIRCVDAPVAANLEWQFAVFSFRTDSIGRWWYAALSFAMLIGG